MRERNSNGGVGRKVSDAIAVAASAYVTAQLQRILVTTGEYFSYTPHIMLSLDAYDSSEDEVETHPPSDTSQRKQAPSPTVGTVQVKTPLDREHPQPQPATVEAPSGPVLGPASVQTPSNGPLEAGRSSPFSTTRALIQDLTLPPVPNLDIPPSPPGSPDPAANAKFEHFLSLKAQGVHFNAKLASSSSLKNPSLLMKMMEHAGIEEQSQYDTSLPAEVWSTSNLPPWGFKEELLKTQQEARQKSEANKSSRDSVEFVSGSRKPNS
ncbi:hypothetical protein N7510_002330 [Penicillium lagena]|uniref:uncharacterized protein n=1 Tax=Penicillium lagena TaxID=94218 RepID=UPI0025408F05|nr:uncharacterized protein N7510_002330 [Penicillium lagena]KAJ5626021.1 hypothetical protein N7510_002330 [Penicillium lagena]